MNQTDRIDQTNQIDRMDQTDCAPTEDARDEALLEFVHGIVELDAFFDHFFHEPFETIGNHCSSWPVRRRNASTYFSRVLATTSAGREGTGGCLFQRMRSR